MTRDCSRKSVAKVVYFWILCKFLLKNIENKSFDLHIQLKSSTFVANIINDIGIHKLLEND